MLNGIALLDYLEQIACKSNSLVIFLRQNHAPEELITRAKHIRTRSINFLMDIESVSESYKDKESELRSKESDG